MVATVYEFRDKYKEELVRSAVAAKPTTPPDVVAALAGDESEFVRWYVGAAECAGQGLAVAYDFHKESADRWGDT